MPACNNELASSPGDEANLLLHYMHNECANLKWVWLASATACRVS